MKLAVGGWQLAAKFRRGGYCLLLTAACQLGCSLPNLESPECADAREAVREFYSFHYANDIAMSPENLKIREKYLTPELYRDLLEDRREKDYFTNSDTPPKAFKVAACKAIDLNLADIGVHLFWKPDEQTTIQKEAEVEAVKQSDKWLVNRVSVH
jgi:hypothetical protein